MSGRPTTADMVYAGLRRGAAARNAVSVRHGRGALTSVEWATTLAALYSRDARWWHILARATVTDHTIPMVYVMAASDAEGAALRAAADWAQSARNYARTTAAAATSAASARVA